MYLLSPLQNTGCEYLSSSQQLQSLSGIFTNAFTSATSSLSFSCNNHSDNETYEIMATLYLQQDLICYSFNENWKKPLKSSIKAKRCSKNWKNLKALRKKLGLYQLLDGSWRGWYQLGLYHLLSACWVTVANSIRNKTFKYVWYKNLLTWTGAHSADDEYQNKITY